MILRRSARFLGGVALAVVMGCAQGSTTPADELDQAGDPCFTDTGANCVDSDTLRRCVDRIWTDVVCAEECLETAPAHVDGVCEEVQQAPDACACELEDPDGCAPGQLACATDEIIAVCDGEQLWVETSCEEVCGELGYAGAAGCDEEVVGSAVCLCEE